VFGGKRGLRGIGGAEGWCRVGVLRRREAAAKLNQKVNKKEEKNINPRKNQNGKLRAKIRNVKRTGNG